MLHIQVSLLLANTRGAVLTGLTCSARWFVMGVSTFGALAASTPSASACVCVSVGLSMHWPQDNATDVPLETGLSIQASGFDAAGLVLAPTDGGAPVALDVVASHASSWACGGTHIIFKPSLLEPNAEYRLTWSGTDVFGSPKELSRSFTTAAAPQPVPALPDPTTVYNFASGGVLAQSNSCLPLQQYAWAWLDFAHYGDGPITVFATSNYETHSLRRSWKFTGSEYWSMPTAKDKTGCVSVALFDRWARLIAAEEQCTPAKCALGLSSQPPDWEAVDEDSCTENPETAPETGPEAAPELGPEIAPEIGPEASVEPVEPVADAAGDTGNDTVVTSDLGQPDAVVGSSGDTSADTTNDPNSVEGAGQTGSLADGCSSTSTSSHLPWWLVVVLLWAARLGSGAYAMRHRRGGRRAVRWRARRRRLFPSPGPRGIRKTRSRYGDDYLLRFGHSFEDLGAQVAPQHRP